MNLSGTTFRAVSNSKNGSLNTETEMRFKTDSDVVTGDYSGGSIIAGHVLGKWSGSGSELDLLYQGATVNGEIQAGRALAKFTRDGDGPDDHAFGMAVADA
jgi:hypothetical protein